MLRKIRVSIKNSICMDLSCIDMWLKSVKMAASVRSECNRLHKISLGRERVIQELYKTKHVREVEAVFVGVPSSGVEQKW